MSDNFYLDKSYNYTNRFDLERFVNFSGEYWDIVQAPIFEAIKLFKPIGIYTISEYPFRPDVVSYNIYEDTQYWPYILSYNNIYNPMDLTFGLKLKYFDISNLDDLIYSYSNYNRKLIK